MKKVLIIHTHPEQQSFCSSLKNEAVSYFQSQGAEVKVSDLYTMGFNPIGYKHDFTQLENPDFFNTRQSRYMPFKTNYFRPT